MALPKERMGIVNRYLLVLLVILLASCSNDSRSSVSSIEGGRFAVGQKLIFSKRIASTQERYDCYIQARCSEKFLVERIPLQMLIISPKGENYSDTLLLYPLIDGYNITSVANGVWRDYRWKIRAGVTFPQNGDWTFIIKNIHHKDISGLKLLGLSIEKESK